MELKDTGEQVGSIGYTVEDNTPIGKLVHIDHEWHDGKMKPAWNTGCSNRNGRAVITEYYRKRNHNDHNKEPAIR
jgi:hypothetical protein